MNSWLILHHLIVSLAKQKNLMQAGCVNKLCRFLVIRLNLMVALMWSLVCLMGHSICTP